MGNQRRRRPFSPGDVLGADDEQRTISRRRIAHLQNSPLGELSQDLLDERSIAGRRILDPGSMFVTDWINRNTASLFPFAIGTTARRILPANPLRTYLLVQNKSGGTLFINFGSNPTQFASLQIDAGGNAEFIGGATGGAFSPQDDIFILGSAAGLDGVVMEGLWTPTAQVIE